MVFNCSLASSVTIGWNLTDSDLIQLEEFGNKLYLSEKITVIFTAIVTILGNSLVLLVTWKERSLHEPNKYFIACLSVADLLVGIFLAPLRVYKLNLKHQSYRAIMSTHLCRFLKWVDMFALTASICSLTFISFDRYLKISKPLQYKSRITTSKSLKIIFIIWLISAALASYAATNYSGNCGILVRVSFYCPFDSSHTGGFYTFLAIAGVLLPTVITSVMYTLIFVIAHKRQKMLRNGQLGERPNDQSQRTVLSQDLKVIRMLLVVVGVFMVCWIPVGIYAFIEFYKGVIGFSLSDLRQKLTTKQIMVLLPHFNSLCNPAIYALLDQKYREAFKHLFQRMMCQRRSSIRQPSDAIELPPLRTR